MLVGIGIALLIISNVLIFSQATSVSSSLTFGGASSYSLFDGKLTFMINNDGQSSFVLSIYAASLIPQIVISSSALKADSLNNINIDSVKFDTNPTITINNIPRNSLNSVPVTIEGQRPGIYSGILIVDGPNSVSIPMTLDVKSNPLQSLMWVINGIAISIGLWKLMKYINERVIIIRRFAAATNGEKTSVFVTSDKNGKAELEAFNSYLKEKEITRGKVVVDAILNIFSIFFGIVLGLITLVNEEFLASMHNLGASEIVILIAVGLGIGSLKEFVYAK